MMLHSKKLIILLVLFFISGMSLSSYAKSNPVNIIPAPLSVKILSGEFIITSKTSVSVFPSSSEVLAVAAFFTNRLDTVAGFTIKPKAVSGLKNIPKNTILFNVINDASLGEEGYQLTVEKDRVVIAAYTAKGLFYGVQSMLQLLPPQIMNPSKAEGVAFKMQAVKIFDKPRFSYRGMHLDVGRHFMPVDFVKQYIDLLAMFKLNTFHWHLTEDQGWRIEIKKYPKLTQLGSMRAETVVGHMGNNPKFDGIPHGGYYTQDQIRDVVDYAAKRYITIIPEIEMPGHALAALTAYPQLSCTGGPFKVATTFGVFDDIFCAGNDSTYIFLQDVLDEVMALFPSKYIHIGGDEAPKTRWHECPKCQALMKAQGLKDEHELQSYFIKRIEKYVVSKGRKIIGWDEILEGGLAPEATVMSWRGIDGGIAAAKQKHDVIMAASSNLYFDHYQADPETEPLAIGGFLPLKMVYAFEPIPTELNADEAKHIIGAQAQIWTEYLKNPSSVEYMLLPRLFALAEIDWTAKDRKDWYDFRERLDNNIQRMAIMGLNYSQGSTKVEVTAKSYKDGKYLMLNLEAERPNMIVHYNLDGNFVSPGSEVAAGPVKVQNSSKLYAGVFIDGQLKSKMINRTVEPHLAAYTEAILTRIDKPDLKPVTMPGLVDGFCGSMDSELTVWNLFQGKENQVTIDLKRIAEPTEITTQFMSVKDRDIVLPVSVEFQVSQDNKDYKFMATVKNDLQVDPQNKRIWNATTKVVAIKARYIRVIIKAESNTANDPKLLLDEVVVK
jgi:hexosaminidase